MLFQFWWKGENRVNRNFKKNWRDADLADTENIRKANEGVRLNWDVGKFVHDMIYTRFKNPIVEPGKISKIEEVEYTDSTEFISCILERTALKIYFNNHLSAKLAIKYRNYKGLIFLIGFILVILLLYRKGIN
jgi:hypothetical protein